MDIEFTKVLTIIYLISALIVLATFLYHMDEMTKHLTPVNRYNVEDTAALFIVMCFVTFVPVLNTLAAYMTVDAHWDKYRMNKPKA